MGLDILLQPVDQVFQADHLFAAGFVAHIDNTPPLSGQAIRSRPVDQFEACQVHIPNRLVPAHSLRQPITRPEAADLRKQIEPGLGASPRRARSPPS